MIIPSIGRIVHFVQSKRVHLPAIIVAIDRETATEDSPVQLHVFGVKDSVREGVRQAEANKKPGTWHECERV